MCGSGTWDLVKKDLTDRQTGIKIYSVKTFRRWPYCHFIGFL